MPNIPSYIIHSDDMKRAVWAAAFVSAYRGGASAREAVKAADEIVAELDALNR